MRFVLLPVMALSVLAAAAPAHGDDSLAEKVRKSIEDGRRSLLNKQKFNGSWENVETRALNFQGGLTSLALLTLLETGMPPTADPVRKGLSYLRTIRSDQTYVVALQTMVFARAAQAADRERIQKNVEWLLAARQRDGWTYSRRGSPDNSNTRYALMGLDAGLAAGAEVDKKALTEIHRFYLKTQLDGGGWLYRPRDDSPTLSMTAAGLCGLLLTEHSLAGEKLRDDGSAEHCGDWEDRAAEMKALRWLGEHFPADIPDNKLRERFALSPFYCLHALEDAGRLTGRRYFGERDWYEIGSRWLIAVQGADGSWQWKDAPLDGSPVVATSFALLFLVRGRTPVLVAKLAYGPHDYDGWNNKSADLRHLVAFTRRELFKNQPLAWQIFDVRGRGAATAEQIREWSDALREAPVVYFNGHDSAPRGREEAILKEYLARGGVVFAEACCGDKRFDDAFRALVKRLYPDVELKPLPADHALWKASGKFTLVPNDWPLLGIDHRGRTVIVYSPKPLAGYWQAGSFERGRGQLAFRVGVSIIAYASGLKVPPPRGSGAN